MEDQQTDLLTNIDLETDGQVRQQLYASARWTKFIAVAMFIVAGLILIIGIVSSASLGSTLRRFSRQYAIFGGYDGPFLIIVFIVVAVVIAGIYSFLFNFSEKVKKALVAENKQDLNAGLRSLKIFFIVTTVIAILTLLNDIVNLFKD